MATDTETCTGQWFSSGGQCLECGKQHELRHQHRFLYMKAGDTMLTCEDCHQVVIISPEEAAKLAGEDIKLDGCPLGLSLPELIFAVACRTPHYVTLAQTYRYWLHGN